LIIACCLLIIARCLLIIACCLFLLAELKNMNWASVASHLLAASPWVRKTDALHVAGRSCTVEILLSRLMVKWWIGFANDVLLQPINKRTTVSPPSLLDRDKRERLYVSVQKVFVFVHLFYSHLLKVLPDKHFNIGISVGTNYWWAISVSGWVVNKEQVIQWWMRFHISLFIGLHLLVYW